MGNGDDGTDVEARDESSSVFTIHDIRDFGVSVQAENRSSRPYIGGSDTRRFVYILRGLLCDVIGIGAPRAPRGAPIPMTSLLRLATWAGPAAAQVGPAAARAGPAVAWAGPAAAPAGLAAARAGPAVARAGPVAARTGA